MAAKATRGSYLIDAHPRRPSSTFAPRPGPAARSIVRNNPPAFQAARTIASAIWEMTCQRWAVMRSRLAVSIIDWYWVTACDLVSVRLRGSRSTSRNRPPAFQAARTIASAADDPRLQKRTHVSILPASITSEKDVTACDIFLPRPVPAARSTSRRLNSRFETKMCRGPNKGQGRISPL